MAELQKFLGCIAELNPYVFSEMLGNSIFSSSEIKKRTGYSGQVSSAQIKSTQVRSVQKFLGWIGRAT